MVSLSRRKEKYFAKALGENVTYASLIKSTSFESECKLKN